MQGPATALVGPTGPLARATEIQLQERSIPVVRLSLETLKSGFPAGIDRVIWFPFALFCRSSERDQWKHDLQVLERFVASREGTGLKRFVLRSTATVYGSSWKNYGLMEENRLPLLRRGSPSARWLKAENVVQPGEPQRRDGPLAILRFAPILEPREGDFLTHLVTARVSAPLAGHDPMVQFLSLEDAARALAAALQSEAAGVFNISTEDAVSFRDALKAGSSIRLPTPGLFQKPVRQLSWRLGLSRFPSESIEQIRYNFTVSPKKAARELGFQPGQSSLEALFPRSGVNDVFHEELGDLPTAIFDDFDYDVIGSASIGQVHKATYKGDIVAIKVQRPGIQKVFERDAMLLNLLVRIVFLFRVRSLYFMRDPVREFHEWIQEELDYYREARHADLLGRNAAKMPKEKVPRVYWEVTTRRILTTEYLDGCTVTEYLRMKAENNEDELAKVARLNFNPTQFVTNIITNFISDALYYGMFHADLHPANLMILKNNVVGYVDFGIVGTFSREARSKAIQLLLSHVSGDPDEILSSFLSISELTDRADVEGFRRHLRKHAQDWYRQPPVGSVARFDQSWSSILMDHLSMCRQYGILPSRDMIRYIRAIMLADGLVSRLSPGLDYGKQLRKLCEDYLASELRRRTLSSQAALTAIADFTGWLQKGPAGLVRAVERLERRQSPFKLNLETGSRQPGVSQTQRTLGSWAWLLTVLWLAFNLQSATADDFLSPPVLVAVSFVIGLGIWLLRSLIKTGS